MAITLERTKELLGVKELPGSPAIINRLLGATDRLIARHGEHWITENRKRLVEEWETVAACPDRGGSSRKELPPAADEDDWAEFDRNEEILTKIVQEHQEKNFSKTEVPGKSQERTSLPFAEISKRHPGRFIDGNAELEAKGITAFILPGGRPQEENVATKEDWKMFEEREKSLDEMAQRALDRSRKK